jgi:hypothetical protein
VITKYIFKYYNTSACPRRDCSKCPDYAHQVHSRHAYQISRLVLLSAQEQNTMSRRQSLERRARNASLNLERFLSLDHAPREPTSSNQRSTALGSPFQYQPPRDSSRSISPLRYLYPEDSSTSFDPPPRPRSLRYLFLEERSTSFDLPPLRPLRDEGSRALGSPFRYQPPKASSRSLSPETIF